MARLDELLKRIENKELAGVIFWRDVEAGVFPEHRDGLITQYCKLIRLHRECDLRNAHFLKSPKITPEGMPSREWCNAAVHILVHAAEDLQRRFLLATDEIQTQMTEAIRADGGIETPEGVWIELPPL